MSSNATDHRIMETYKRLGEKEQSILRSAANDPNKTKAVSLARLYFPKEKDEDISRFLSTLLRGL